MCRVLRSWIGRFQGRRVFRLMLCVPIINSARRPRIGERVWFEGEGVRRQTRFLVQADEPCAII